MPDEVYKALKPADLLTNKESVIVVDFWRCLPDSIRRHPAIRYIPIGRCIDDAAAISKVAELWRSDKH
jgi:hypothetical protein